MSLWANGLEPKVIKQAFEIKQEVQHNMTAEGTVKTASYVNMRDSKMFNDRGELSASSRADAFRQGEKYASSHLGLTQEIIQAKLNMSEITESLTQAQGGDVAQLARFASSVAPLILERLDYQGCIRQMLLTHQVQQGEIIRYERDVNVTATEIHEDGSIAPVAVNGDSILPGTFLISARPEVSIYESLIRQYDIISRVQDKTAFQIQLTEDRKGFRLFKDAADSSGNAFEYTGTVGKEVLEDISNQIERERLTLDKYIMNRTQYGDLKKGMNAMEFDPVTSREMLNSGMLSMFWGKPILVGAGIDRPGQENNAIPEGFVWGVAAPEWVGRMPIRQELMVLDAPKFVHGEFKYSWLYGEFLGMIITNPRAVAYAKKQGAVTPKWM